MQKMILAAALLASAALAVFPVQADDHKSSVFERMCDQSPDGKVSKTQVMTIVEKMFDKADTRREGKLDKKQAEFFWKQFTAESGM